ncbi:MAG: CCA tRNA nucleotidyltransferase [candidate division Zixibacteria bacterium]|nr:CCA tRNA nucleotidyltransferase [candidate division Zixibacteria bacterium]MDD5427473.1 CCA tRNA nucleotidyltransferase [candidate division Zixibacteria bacterium]
MCKLSSEAIEGILQNGRIYEVGGAVRDKFMGVESDIKDRDYLVTGIPYDELTGILERYGRVDLVGKSFGVIKFTQFIKGHPYTFDISLPRKEFSTGIGHRDFNVSFDPALKVEDDLSRRDFTINAMALALDNGMLIDPLDGRADLEKRSLRMTSVNSFLEDPLRMLRAVQMAARFEFTIEPDTYKAIVENAALIASVSPERISEEFNKLLQRARKPSIGFRLMHTTGLLKEILPELENCVGVTQPGGFHKYDVFEHTLRAVDNCPPLLHLRMAAIFHDITKPIHKREVADGATFYGHEISSARTAQEVLNRLRYPGEFIRAVVTLVEKHMFTTQVTDKGLRRLVKRVGVALIFDLLDLRRADVVAQGMGGTTEDVDELEKNIRLELTRKPPFSLSDLAIDGHDVMQRYHLEPGKTVGMILNYLLDAVLDDPQLNSRESLEALADKFYEDIKAKDIDSSKDKESSL